MELDEELLISSRLGSGSVYAKASLRGWGRLDGFVIATTITADRGAHTAATEMMETRHLIDGGCAHVQASIPARCDEGMQHMMMMPPYSWPEHLVGR